jgi:hypothetical protein
MKQKPQAPIYVSIVSANPETLDGLQSYLGEAGVPSHCTGAVRDPATAAPPFAIAAVIFPDDFEQEAVRALMQQLRRTRPDLLSLIVTREPQRFVEMVQPDGRSLPPIMLPRPAFGWDILDAIRAHAVSARV